MHSTRFFFRDEALEVKDQIIPKDFQMGESSEQVNSCEWCGLDASGFGSVTFDNGVEVLEFCCNECMENWEERDFDRRAERAYERSLQ